MRKINYMSDSDDEISPRHRRSRRIRSESEGDLSYNELTIPKTDGSRRKRARIEEHQLTRTGSARVSLRNGAVEAGLANHDPLEPPLSDPVIRIHVGAQVFEIQLSRLGHHSEWFSRKSDNIDNRDTRKVVLTNVSAEDFGNLVKAMDKTFDSIRRTPETIELLSILRAANALEFTSISSYVIKCLKGTWSLSCSKITEKRLQDAVVVIQHAHQFDLPQLQRAPVYLLSYSRMVVASEFCYESYHFRVWTRHWSLNWNPPHFAQSIFLRSI